MNICVYLSSPLSSSKKSLDVRPSKQRSYLFLSLPSSQTCDKRRGELDSLEMLTKEEEEKEKRSN